MVEQRYLITFVCVEEHRCVPGRKYMIRDAFTPEAAQQAVGEMPTCYHGPMRIAKIVSLGTARDFVP